MGSAFYNDNGTIKRAQMYYNDNGIIKSENDMEIMANVGTEVLAMPQKQNLILNITPNYSFAFNTTQGSNYMIEDNRTDILKAHNSIWDAYCDENQMGVSRTVANSDIDRSVNTEKGIWCFGKDWNQFNFNLPEPIFDGTNQATISMSMNHTSHNNDGFFWWLDNNTKWGIQGHWSPFIFRFRNNVNSGYFELPSRYGESGAKNIIVTFNGRTVKVYWNGQKVAENNTINTDQGICRRIFLNSYYDLRSTFCNMGLISFRVWKTALSDDEVAKAFKFDAGYIN